MLSKYLDKVKIEKLEISTSQEDLLLFQEAKNLIDSPLSGYLTPRQRSILKGAIKLVDSKQDYADVREYTQKFILKAQKQKLQIEEDQKNKLEKEKRFIQSLYGDKTKNQLIRSLVKLEIEQEQLNRKFSSLKSNNPADRTQRKAKINNSLDSNALRLRQLREVIQLRSENLFKRYTDITDRLYTLHNKIEKIEMSIPHLSTYEQRKPFFKKLEPLKKEKEYLTKEKTSIEAPYVVLRKGKKIFAYTEFALKNKK